MKTLYASDLKKLFTFGEFQKILDKPLEKGGAGMDIRIAHRIARRMELLMLGKYQLMSRQESEKLELIEREDESS